MRTKKPLSSIVLLMVVLSLLSALGANTIGVSAAESPYIAVVPDSISGVPPDTNITVYIYTDYVGTVHPTWDYITGYQFALSYNPSVLKGVEVVNGDLIVENPYGNHTEFIAGPFDNVAGELSLTVGYYDVAGEVTQGPGTLANVTFTVVGTGASDITIDSHTKLKGWNDYVEPYAYDIINAAEQPGATEPPYGSDHIQHGYFQNDAVTHDVAVTSVTPASTAVIAGASVDITVNVTNEGNINEAFNVTAYANDTAIETKTVTNLGSHNATKSLTFGWDTTSWDLGTYNISAEAVVAVDDDLNDNLLPDGEVLVYVPQYDPIAIITCEEISAYPNETMSFSGVQSYDPDLYTPQEPGGIISYYWDFGDLTSATGLSVAHEYETIGIYTLNLTVTDSQNQVGSTTLDIKIEEPPAIPPEYAADLVKWKVKPEAHYCAVGPVSVTGESVGVETWTTVTGEAVGVGGHGITVFSLDNTPVIDESETIYVGGVAQTKDTDYAIDYTTGTITFTKAPRKNMEITADYTYWIPTFYLDNTPVIDESETIYVGGVAQTKDTDYAIDYTTGTITFISVLNDSSAVTADYEYMDIFVTLTALAANLGAKPVNVAITFAILDGKWGVPAGPALIENVTLAVGETAPVSVEFDPNDYGYTGTKITLYADVTLEYYDADTETWIPASTKIIHFAVGP